jgi:hypothetical protein
MVDGFPVSLSVTIDDGGLHSSITGAIEACAKIRAADRVSVIATGPEWLEACTTASSAGLSLSAHLNCVEPPFLGGSKFPSSFAGWTCAVGRLTEDVRKEWSMQIEKLLSAGFELSRLDSHRHLHHLGRLREVILDLAREYGIGTVRAAILPDRFSRLSGLVLNGLALRLARLARSRGICTTASILGFSRSGSVDRTYLERFRSRLPRGECELVMHPALEPVWSEGQPKELGMMLSDWFGEWSHRSS